MSKLLDAAGNLFDDLFQDAKTVVSDVRKSLDSISVPVPKKSEVDPVLAKRLMDRGDYNTLNALEGRKQFVFDTTRRDAPLPLKNKSTIPVQPATPQSPFLAKSPVEKAEVAGNLFADLFRAVPRAITSVGLETASGAVSLATNKNIESVYTPTSPFEKFALGEGPIKGVFKQTEELQKTGQSALESLGVSPQKSQAFSMGFAGPITALTTAIDLTPFGGEENAAKKIAKSKSAEEIFSLVKPMLKDKTEQEVKAVAESLVNVTRAAEVKDVILKQVATQPTVEKQIQRPLLEEAKKYANADDFVKAQGTPVYHGTNANFENFNVSKSGVRDAGWYGKGMYFADKQDIAALHGKNLKEAYVELKNPYIITKENIEPERQRALKMGSDKYTEYLKSKGYDGVIAERPFAHKKDNYVVKTYKEVVAFEDSQIKTKSQLTDIWNQAQEKIKPSTPPLPTFQRAANLGPEERKIESAAFSKISKEENAILADYAERNGNYVNSDDLRREFIDEGYKGTNSTAVQKPVSYLSKKAYSNALRNNPGEFAVFTAGQSGAGKTSALKNISNFDSIKKDASVIFDSNLSSYDSAAAKIEEASKAGKAPVVFYVYREPLDGFENGVVKRMLSNADEMGRVVPNSVVAENAVGSFEVAKRLSDEGVQVHFIDNSLGAGKAREISKQEMIDKVKFPKDLKGMFDTKVDELHAAGKITPEQHRAYRGTPSEIADVLPSAEDAKIKQAFEAPDPEEAKKILDSRSDKLLNLDHFNIDDTAKLVVDDTINAVKPKVEEKVGQTLSNAEVRSLANESSRVLEQAIGREDTKKWEAAMFNLRERIAAQAKEGTVTKDFIDDLVALKSQATNAGRRLQSLGMMADPRKKTAQEILIQNIADTGAKIDDILKQAQGVDFNDFNEAAKFYRQFVKPKASEWLDLLRYNSMLSSPNTHINNAFGNLLNSVAVAPIEKALTGGLDWLGSTVTGKGRKAFAGESGAYLKGYFSNLKEAADEFLDVLAGRKNTTNLDTDLIPVAVEGTKGKVVSVLSYPMKLLEGMDRFFGVLTHNGELSALKYRASKGIETKLPEEVAREAADYRLFRQDIADLEGKQGGLLDAVDQFTKIIQMARNNKNPIVSTVAKYTLPFIRTPMNIFKQGIEYSPLGFTTLLGKNVENRTAQLSKALIGSAVFASAAQLLTSNRLTWSEPIGEKEKQLFKQAGKQSYSIKIGDKWVSYQRLPPALAFPFAMVASIDDLIKRKKADDKLSDTILGGIAKYGQFLADQSYAKSIGDLLNAVGRGESGIAKVISNYPMQLVPYRAFGGWMARLVDNAQRKVDPDAGFIEKQMQLLMMNVPGLSQKVPARLDVNGDPIKNPDNEINAFSPVKISTENNTFAEYLKNYEALNKAAEAKQAEEDYQKKRILPIYKKIQEAKKVGDLEGADIMLEGLTDQEYEIYKKIKSADKTRQTLDMEVKMYPVYKQIQELKSEGKDSDVQEILDAMTDDQYDVYLKIKNRLKTEN